MKILEALDINFKLTIAVIFIIVGALITTKLIRWLMDKSFSSASEIMQVDATRYKFIKNAVSFIIWIVVIGVIVSLIPQLKSLAVTLFAGAGILVAIIGFAAQAAFSNIISGVFIVMFKPFRVGDMIKVGSQSYGIVEDITLRHTVIKNFENKRIIIPNSIIGSETIVNDSISDQRICRWIQLGISYDSDLDLAIKIIQDACDANPRTIDDRTPEEIENGEPRTEVRVMNFGDSSIDLRAYAWMDDPLNAVKMASEILQEIKKQFDLQDIEIPFPHRTIVYKKDIPRKND